MRGMQTWRWVSAALLLAMGGTAGRADEFAIQLLDKGGERIVFGAVDGATNYQVKTAPTPTGVWSVAVDAVPPTEANAVTATVAMAAATAFYQVVAYTNVPPAAPQGMVQIPGGTNSGTDPDFGVYSLTVEAFHMDRHEVTNDEMVRVMQWAYGQGKLNVTAATVENAQGDQQELLDLDGEGCRITWDGAGFGMKSAKGSGYPCVMVSWYGAAAYCNYRSEMDGRTACYNLSDWTCNFAANGYRLPTNTEWEYAARGGLSGMRFPWGDTIQHSLANYYSFQSFFYDTSPTRDYHPDYNNGGFPYMSPVGSFAANGYGLYDMVGNVSEWCWDSLNSARSLRGGSWQDLASYVRCGVLTWNSPGSGSDRRGIRAVCR